MRRFRDIGANPDDQHLVALIRLAIARRCAGREHVTPEEIDARAREAVWQLCDALDCRKPENSELDALVVAAVRNLAERAVIEPYRGGFRRVGR